MSGDQATQWPTDEEFRLIAHITGSVGLATASFGARMWEVGEHAENFSVIADALEGYAADLEIAARNIRVRSKQFRSAVPKSEGRRHDN